MTWGQRRKLLYFGIFVAVIVIGIGVPIFTLVYEKPTCFDNKQNQNEQGIDCGGTCIKLCKNLQLQPVVRWQQAFNVGERLYTAVAYINNANLNAEALDVPYTFTLYDAQNVVITTRKGTIDIPPGKNFAVIEPNITLSDKIPVRTLFEFGPEYSWKLITKKPPLLTVEDQVWSDTDTAPRITAQIINSTFEDIERVDVAVIVYDEQKNAFAASKTYITNLQSESKRDIVFTWRQPFPKQVSSIEIIPIPQ
jgi:hypothetical protein